MFQGDPGLGFLGSRVPGFQGSRVLGVIVANVLRGSCLAVPGFQAPAELWVCSWQNVLRGLTWIWPRVLLAAAASPQPWSPSARPPYAMAPKLAADPTITVSSLQLALEAWFASVGTRNLDKLMQPARALSWRRAPRADVLAQFHGLVGGLLEVAPNGKLPAKKLQLAIEAVHKVNPVVYRNVGDVGLWAVEMGFLMRVLVAKFRELQEPEARRKSLGKAAGLLRVRCFSIICHRSKLSR